MSVLSFVFLCLGLALRAPVWPAHGWFLQVAAEAPASVFVATAAVTVPVATLIFARLANRLFPEILDASALWILIAGALNLFVGSVTVLNQKRLSGILALLAMSHMGLGLIGLGSQNGNALAGVIYHQLGVGLAVAAMGLLFGGIVKRAGFTELTGSSAGLAERAPAAAAMSGLAIAAFLGIPGMSGFVGQSLIVMGGFSTHPAVLFAVGAAMVLIAYSLFGLFRQLFLGAPSPGESDSGKGLDLSTRERFLMAPLVGLMILLGFYPKPFLDWVRPTAVSLVERGGSSAMSGPAPESNPVQPAEPKGP